MARLAHLMGVLGLLGLMLMGGASAGYSSYRGSCDIDAFQRTRANGYACSARGGWATRSVRGGPRRVSWNTYIDVTCPPGWRGGKSQWKCTRWGMQFAGPKYQSALPRCIPPANTCQVNFDITSFGRVYGYLGSASLPPKPAGSIASPASGTVSKGRIVVVACDIANGYTAAWGCPSKVPVMCSAGGRWVNAGALLKLKCVKGNPTPTTCTIASLTSQVSSSRTVDTTTYSSTTVVVGGAVSVKCAGGYQANTTVTTVSVSCGTGGVWNTTSLTTLVCVPSTPPTSTCSIATLTSQIGTTTAVDSTTVVASVPVNSTVSVKCSTGYQANTTTTTVSVTCGAGGVWNTTSVSNLTCVANPTITCTAGFNVTLAANQTTSRNLPNLALSNQAATIVGTSSTALTASSSVPANTQVTVSCATGFTANSSTSSVLITCGADGNWTAVDKLANLTCAATPVMTCLAGFNATLAVGATTSRTLPNITALNQVATSSAGSILTATSAVNANTVVTVTCAAGFKNSTNVTSVAVPCGTDGSWNVTTLSSLGCVVNTTTNTSVPGCTAVDVLSQAVLLTGSSCTLKEFDAPFTASSRGFRAKWCNEWGCSNGGRPLAGSYYRTRGYELEDRAVHAQGGCGSKKEHKVVFGSNATCTGNLTFSYTYTVNPLDCRLSHSNSTLSAYLNIQATPTATEQVVVPITECGLGMSKAGTVTLQLVAGQTWGISFGGMLGGKCREVSSSVILAPAA